ncbi:MAG: endolytic transglycosylase MltG [Anaerolineae bacterium]|nr:endolytic transglycosylase MltG [Anaerolineae bacterium]
MPARTLLRNILIPVVLAVALLICGIGGLAIATRPPNSRINPLEALVLRIVLQTRSQALQTPAGTDPTPLRFVISKGDNATTIGAKLVSQGLITDTELFKNYVRYYGIDAQLQAGTYFLRKTYTIPEIAQSLTNVGNSTVTVQVIEGWRLEEIAKAIDANSMLAFKGADFLKLVGTGATVTPEFATAVGLAPGKSLEGFLFPDTYTLPADAPADELVLRMLQNFDTQITPQMRADAQAQGLTLYQVVTLASIVEREAVVPDERPIIASVYLNRLKVPMTLDADPTVQYALGNTRDAATWWPNITVSDYRGVNSPYNTYLNNGLPPGPIANPGLASIRAVIYPAQTNYLFFRATCERDGRHKFAVTLAEQQANACP